MGTYVSIICENETIANTNLAKLRKVFGCDEKSRVAMASEKVAGNEIFIPVPECGGLGFSLSALKTALVAPARVDLFELERDADGKYSRYWYMLEESLLCR